MHQALIWRRGAAQQVATFKRFVMAIFSWSGVVQQNHKLQKDSSLGYDEQKVVPKFEILP